MARDLSKPQYNRCDYCGRNPHKVAVRLYDNVVREHQLSADSRAAYYRRKPLKVWPTVGYCPSCFADAVAHDPAFPTKGTVVYDRRARKPEQPKTERVVVPDPVTGIGHWKACGHRSELDINEHCYTCHQPVDVEVAA